MLHESFAEAFVHRQPPFWARVAASLCRGVPFSAHKVCGLRLRPFSRWHAANLDFIQSPLLILVVVPESERGEILISLKALGLLDFATLWMAIECCRLRFPKPFSRHRGIFHRFRMKMGLRRYLRDPDRQIANFAEYLDDYISRPEPVIDEDAGGSIKTPWYLFEVCVLQQKISGISEAQSWDMSMGTGVWYVTGHAEASGNKIDIITPEDEAQLDELGIEH